MKVRELMTEPAVTCRSDDELTTAAMSMWGRDCGAVPVVDDRSPRVVGMITDRDICMAVATRKTAPDRIHVSEVMNGTLHAVQPEDDIEKALQVMADARVRRLPVLGEQGEALGILSLNDAILRLESGPASRPPTSALLQSVVRTMRAVSEHGQERVTATDQ